MSGWIAILVLGAAAAAGLYFLGRLRGPLLQLALAALLFGFAGYAVQGHPGLAGSPRAVARPIASADSLDAERHAVLGRFDTADRWLTISDSYLSRGATEDAVGVVRSALRAHPDDADLWIGLGNALVDHSNGLSPAAQLAYERAAELSPRHPGAPFFYGLALARSGNRDGALEVWKQLRAESPPGASWLPDLDQRIAALEGQAP